MWHPKPVSVRSSHGFMPSCVAVAILTRFTFEFQAVTKYSNGPRRRGILVHRDDECVGHARATGRRDRLVATTGRHVDADAQGRFAFDVPRGDFVLSVRRTRDDDFDDRDDRVVPGGSQGLRLVVP
jgi:hypothetical protein